jgi:hypothetical protein
LNPSPEFSVTRVDDGRVYGLLLEKQAKPGTDPERDYFCFPPGTGKCCLQPTPTIRRNCTCHELSYSEQLECVLHVLAEYAAFAHANGDMRAPLSVTPLLRNYSKTASALFKRSSAFSEFVGNYDVFRKCILTRDRKRDVFSGKARLFRAWTPDQTYFPNEQFEFLQTVDEALEFHRRTVAMWFRGTGPTFVDFKKKMVCRCRVLDRLLAHVAQNPESVLIGESSAGKSVLVRYLAYELRCAGKTPVYYYRHRRDVRIGALAAEVNSVSGLIILDDVHGDPGTYLDVCKRVRVGTARRLLLTASPDFLPSYLADGDAAARSHVFAVSGLDGRDEIINDFVEQHPVIARSDLDTIKQIAGQDLWLLACTLEGCKQKKGFGHAQDWPRDGICRRLALLESHDGVDPRYLLALAPLALHGTMTAERYLTDVLGIPRADLRKLLQVHGATSAVVDGERYYSIPHRSLARAYWEHGGSYRFPVPGYEDFLLRYALAGMPNSLEAVMEAPEDVRASILSRVDAEGGLARMLKEERSIVHVAKWASAVRRVDEPIARIIADKIAGDPNLNHSAECVRKIWTIACGAGRTVADYLDPPRLAALLVQSDPSMGATRLLQVIDLLDHEAPGSESRTPPIAARVCACIPVKQLADRLVLGADVSSKADLLRSICLILGAPPPGLASYIDWDGIARQLAATDEFLGAAGFLQALYMVAPAKKHGLWGMSTVANRLAREASWDKLVDTIVQLDRIDSKAARDLCAALDSSEIVAKPVESGELGTAVHAVIILCLAHAAHAQNLVALLDHSRWAKVDGAHDTVTYAWLWMRLLWQLEHGLRKQLCEQLPWQEWAPRPEWVQRWHPAESVVGDLGEISPRCRDLLVTASGPAS